MSTEHGEADGSGIVTGGGGHVMTDVGKDNYFVLGTMYTLYPRYNKALFQRNTLLSKKKN